MGKPFLFIIDKQDYYQFYLIFLTFLEIEIQTYFDYD